MPDTVKSYVLPCSAPPIVSTTLFLSSLNSALPTVTPSDTVKLAGSGASISLLKLTRTSVLLLAAAVALNSSVVPPLSVAALTLAVHFIILMFLGYLRFVVLTFTLIFARPTPLPFSITDDAVLP